MADNEEQQPAPPTSPYTEDDKITGEGRGTYQTEADIPDDEIATALADGEVSASELAALTTGKGLSYEQVLTIQNHLAGHAHHPTAEEEEAKRVEEEKKRGEIGGSKGEGPEPLANNGKGLNEGGIFGEAMNMMRDAVGEASEGMAPDAKAPSFVQGLAKEAENPSKGGGVDMSYYSRMSEERSPKKK